MLIERNGNDVAITVAHIGDPAVGIIRRAPQKGNWRGSTWLCPATKRTLEYFENKGEWSEEARHFLDTLHLLSVGAAPREVLDFPFKRRPYDHQAKIFRESRDHKAAAYFMQQRTGKSNVAINKLAYHFGRGEVDAAIVIAWPKGVHVDWVRGTEKDPSYFEKDMPDHVKYRAMAWDASKTSKSWWQGNIVPLLTPVPGELAIFTANADGLISKRLFELCQDFIAAYAGRVMIIFDECTAFASHSSKAYKLALKLAKQCAIRVIMTGTPSERNPLSWYPMFNLADDGLFGFESFTSFRNRYAVTKPLYGKNGKPKLSKWGRVIEIVDGYQHLDELREKAAHMTWRVLLSDVYKDMPPRLYEKIHCDLTPKQRHLYTELRDEFVVALNGARMTAPMAMTRMMRLHQVCLNIFTPNGLEAIPIEEGSHPRLQALRDWCSLSDGKVIVWSTFRLSLRDALQALDHDGGAVGLWGDHSPDERVENLRRWRNEKSCKFIVGHPRVLGYGYNLSEADRTVFYANGYSLEARLQCEARPEFIGMTATHLYGDVMADNTMESHIIDLLKEKRDVASILTGDILKEWI